MSSVNGKTAPGLKSALTNRLAEINSVIGRKIQDKRTGRVSQPIQQHDKPIYPVNEHCLCCSRLTRREHNSPEQNNLDSKLRQHSCRLKESSRHFIFTQSVSQTVHPPVCMPVTSEEYSTLRMQNLRLIQANMQIEDSFARLKEQIESRVYLCKSSVQGYNAVRANVQLDVVLRLLESFKTGDRQRTATFSKELLEADQVSSKLQEQDDIEYYHRFQSTLKTAVLDSAEGVFPRTKQLLIESSYLSIEQLSQDISDLNADRSKQHSLEEAIRSSLQDMAAEIGEEIEVRAYKNYRRTVCFNNELTEIRDAIDKRSSEAMNKKEAENIIDLLYRAALRIGDDEPFIQEIEQLIHRIQIAHGLAPLERRNSNLLEGSFPERQSLNKHFQDMPSWYNMLLIQAEAIEQFIENIDPDPCEY